MPTSNARKCLLVLGSFVAHFISLGVACSFGVIYSELLDYFDSGKGETGWIASLFNGLFLGAGVVGGVLTSKIGSRVTTVAGALILSGGLVACIFVRQIHLLYLTYGIIGGLGSCLVHIAGSVVVNQHFDKHRSLAVGIASSGVGVANMALPPLTAYLIEEYGWRGAFLLLGGICLQGVLAGVVFEDVRGMGQEKSSLEPQGPVTQPKPCSVFSFVTSSYVSFLFSGFFASLAFFVPYVMLPDMVKLKGFQTETAAFVASSMGAGNILGRMIFGPLSDKMHFDRVYLHIGALLLCGGTTISCVYFKRFYLFILYGIVFGTGTGVFGLLQSVITMDLAGREELSVALGLLTTVEGVGAILGPPIAGWIADAKSTYTEAFYFSGLSFLLGAMCAIYIVMRRSCLPSTCMRKYSSKYEIEMSLQQNK